MRAHQLILLAALWGAASSAQGEPGNGEPLVRYRVLPGDPQPSDNFGTQVAVSGHRAIVALSRFENATVTVFDTRTGRELWRLVGEDTDADDQFGTRVGIDGDVAIVGAWLDDDVEPNAGSAYLFDLTTGEQLFELQAEDGGTGDWFGRAVAIEGSIAVVGSPRHDNPSGSGSVYLFDVGTGVQIRRLEPDDGEQGDMFGGAVAISGTTVLVGAHDDDDNGDGSGSAYLFDATTGEQLAKLLPEDGALWRDFGGAVDIEGDFAVIGSRTALGSGPDSAYVFDVATGQQTLKLEAFRLTHGDFGESVGVSGGIAVVGAPEDLGPNGSVYLFDATTGEQLTRLLPEDGAPHDRFGDSVAIDGSRIVIGAPGNDDPNLVDVGAAYLFDEHPGAPFCIGDTGCPCGNDDPSGSAGCASSTGSGAVLRGCGTKSVARDDLVLTVSNIPSPNANGLFFLGPSELPPFVPGSSDGLACTGGFRFPGMLDDNKPPNELVLTDIVAQVDAGGGSIHPGQTWNFQCWTRDNNGSPCGGSSNLSNAYSVTFTP